MNTEKSDNNDTEPQDPLLKILDQAGSSGKFQIVYKWIFILGLSAFGAMIYMNIFLALDEPDHWCDVPGREKTNLTLDEWKDLTLPKELDNRNVETFSKCKMYDRNFTDVGHAMLSKQFNVTNAETKGCPYGFSYDKTWYERTITSQENWICEKELYVTNTFVVNRVSEVVGALFLGQLGDTLGRRFVYYIGVVLSTIGRFLCTFTQSSFPMFLFMSSLAALTVNSLFQSPAVIAMEMSGEDERSNIAMYQTFGWFLGTSIMPFIFWWLRDWVPFLWLTTLPTLLVLIFYKYAIESPRWLISKRRYADALVQLKTIAHINGRTITITEKELADMYGYSDEEVIGMASLFNGWRIAKNTIIMGFSWCVLAISYFTLVLFSSRMGGNPFLNFSLQNFVEVPACIVGKYLGDKYGRRLTNSISYFICFFACIPVIVLCQSSEYEYLMTLIATFIKFLTAAIYFLLALQSVEIYPTCLRQTGIALGTILYNAVGVLAPYLVHLGTKYDIRYPYLILGLLFFMGGISGLFLPETLHYRLPDTLEAAKIFGKNQKFFSLPKAHSHRSSEEEKLNQPKFNP